MKTAIIIADNTNILNGAKNYHKSDAARFSYDNFLNMYISYFGYCVEDVIISASGSNSTFIRYAADRGFNFFEGWNTSNGEKAVDTTAVAYGVKSLFDYKPNCIVILSGDLDFYPLAEIAIEKFFCEVHFWSFKGTTNNNLESVCTDFFYIDDYDYLTYINDQQQQPNIYEEGFNPTGFDTSAYKVDLPDNRPYLRIRKLPENS